MSRSYKKSPHISHTMAESDKPYKEQEHRRERRIAKQIVTSAHDYDDVVFPDKEMFGGEWNAPKDGRHYYANHTKKDLRK